MIQGYLRIRQLTESARTRTTGRIKVSLITIWRERSKLTVILMHKQNFSVIQFTGVSNLAFNAGTNEVTITGSPTGTYSLNTYNIQIIW